MYDNELSVAIQQERERAIREARLHHRHDLLREPSWLARLLAVARPRLPRRPVDQTGTASRSGPAETQPAIPGSAGRPCAAGSTTAPG